MADGFDIHLDADQAARLRAAARLLGVSPSQYALTLIEDALAGLPIGTVDPDPAIDEAIADDVERTGDAMSWPAFRERLRRFGGGDA